MEEVVVSLHVVARPSRIDAETLLRAALERLAPDAELLQHRLGFGREMLADAPRAEVARFDEQHSHPEAGELRGRHRARGASARDEHVHVGGGSRRSCSPRQITPEAALSRLMQPQKRAARALEAL